MSRRIRSLNDYRSRLNTSQDQLVSVSAEPSAPWMDDLSRRYSLRELAANLVKVDRLMLYQSTSSRRRRPNQWPPVAHSEITR